MRTALRTLRWLPMMALAGLMLLPQSARADYPNPAVYIGVDGGGVFRLRDWDLGNGKNGYPSKRAFGDVGVRLGIQIIKQLALEAEVGYMPLKHDGETNHVLSYDLNLLVHFLKGNWTPVIEAGFGGYSNLKGNLGKDKADPRIHVGLGVRGLVLPWMAVRLDLRDVMSDGLDKGGANNLELLAGLDFFLVHGHKAAPKPSDRDKDGILDADDACPDEPGPVATQGCPDKDGDGIIDKKDRCPDQAGVKEFKGCPDKDGDGIPDVDDKCPEVRGLKEYEGCLPAKAAKFTGAIKGINFATGKATILANSNKVLDGAVAVLKEFPSLRLRIEGHTDNVGTPESNQALSEARATAVRDYMVKKGIAGDRLESVGYGETKPIQDNATAGGRAANRRTEFTVLGQN